MGCTSPGTCSPTPKCRCSTPGCPTPWAPIGARSASWPASSPKPPWWCRATGRRPTATRPAAGWPPTSATSTSYTPAPTRDWRVTSCASSTGSSWRSWGRAPPGEQSVTAQPGDLAPLALGGPAGASLASRDCGLLDLRGRRRGLVDHRLGGHRGTHPFAQRFADDDDAFARPAAHHQDRKSTRLNSSYVAISYAVFCLK